MKKAKPQKLVKITVLFPEEVVDELRKLAKAGKVKTPAAVRTIVENSLTLSRLMTNLFKEMAEAKLDLYEGTHAGTRIFKDPDGHREESKNDIGEGKP